MQTDWPFAIHSVFQTLYIQAMHELPSVILAVILILAGFILGAAAKDLIRQIFKRTRVDDVLVASGAHNVVERTGFELDTGNFIGILLKWFIILFFLDIALDVLNLQAATAFLATIVLGYLPRIFVAAVIFFGAFVLAHILEKMIVAGGIAQSEQASKTLGRLTRVVILVSAMLAVLIQLKIAEQMALMLFGGIVFATSLALGIAFGYGGRGAATRYVESVFGKNEQ